MKENHYFKTLIKRVSMLVLIIIPIIIYSCHKESNLTALTSPDQAATIMQQWLIKQKVIDSTNYYSVSLLTAQVDWTKAHTVASDSGSTYYIASLTSSGQIFNDATTMLNRYLVLKEYKDSIINSNIIEVLGNKNDIVKMADALITGYNKNQINSVNATVSLLSWNNAYKESKIFSNGLLHIRKILVAKGKQKPVIQSTGGSKILNDCTDWYWDTYINGDLVDEEYLYTTCDNDCQSDAVYDITGAMKIKLNCGGGGGSDTPPPPPDTVRVDVNYSSVETQYGDVDQESDGTTGPNAGTSAMAAVQIQYAYHAQLLTLETTGEIVGVVMDPVTASPMNSLYIDSYGRSVTRSLTLFGQSNSYSILSATSVYLSWSCAVNGRYTYTDGSPVYTRQWTNSYSTVR